MAPWRHRPHLLNAWTISRWDRAALDLAYLLILDGDLGHAGALRQATHRLHRHPDTHLEVQLLGHLLKGQQRPQAPGTRLRVSLHDVRREVEREKP
jgi:hypothetical protein